MLDLATNSQIKFPEQRTPKLYVVKRSTQIQMACRLVFPLIKRKFEIGGIQVPNNIQRACIKRQSTDGQA